jgi:lipopolysaccharide biosynthesis glycosyltransferase
VNKKAIAFVLDDTYLEPGRLAIKDVCERAGGRYPVYVFHGLSLSEKSREKLKSLGQKYDIDIRLKDISQSGKMFMELDIRTHVSAVAYAKHLLGDLLWEGFNTVYYFDVDILVLGDLSELFNVVPSKAMAAVDHRASDHLHRLIGKHGNYYNTGVFAANLVRWQSINAVDKFKKAISEHSHKFKYHDQDIFAVAFENEIEDLPIELNFMLNGRFNEFVTNTAEADWDEKIVQPKIVHFIGPTKPWTPNANRPSHKMWRKRISLL